MAPVTLCRAVRMVLPLERVRSPRSRMVCGCPLCAGSWWFGLFDGEAVEGFSKGLERLLVAAEVPVPRARPQGQAPLHFGLGDGHGTPHDH